MDGLRDTVIVIIHNQLAGGVLHFAGGVDFAAAGVARLDLANHRLGLSFLARGHCMEAHHGVPALYRGVLARQPAPGFEQDLGSRFVVDQAGGLDLCALLCRAGRQPVQFHVVLHGQLSRRRFVGGAVGFAVAVLKQESGQLVRIGLAR